MNLYSFSTILQKGYFFNSNTDGCESQVLADGMCCDLDTPSSDLAIQIIIVVAVSIFLIAVIIGYIRRSIKQKNTPQQQQSPARQQHGSRFAPARQQQMTGAYPQGSVLTPQQYEEQQMQMQQIQQIQPIQLPMQPMQGQGVVARPTMQVAMAVPVPVMTVPVVKVGQQPVVQYS